MYDITRRHPEFLTQAIDAFYRYLAQDPKSQKILATLTPEEYDHLKLRQKDHWSMLVKPNIDHLLLRHNATHVGEVHGILGIPSASIANGGGFFQRALFDAIHTLTLSNTKKRELMDILASRIQEETEIQLSAIDAHHNLLDRLISKTIKPNQHHLWMDKLNHHLTILAQLPGVSAVFWIGRNHQNHCVIENSIINQEIVFDQFFAHYLQPRVQEMAIADYPKAIDIYNIAQLPLSADHIPKGFRSLTLRPVFDLSDSLSGWVAVLGIYPAMFMGRASKRFIDISVAQFKVNVLHQHERHLGLSEQAIHALKHYLYHGGLTFFYQPIVSLKQGECHKFEALARLYDDQGNLIAPGQFLPHFGYKEIKFIFLEGLKQTLTQLKQWQQQGFLFEINLNLPPELLIDPNCVLWIADALDTYHIEAKRLHLELLENEAISDDKQRAQAIKALNQLGVSLKMDDLGSGHSGLIRLKEFYLFQELKLTNN